MEGLNIQPAGIYVDVTFGGGGHSREILKNLKKGKLIAFDQDDCAAINKPVDDRFLFLNQNFRFLKNNLRSYGITAVDGLLADLGVSFHQFDEPERGFSFRNDTVLDMRMNKSAGVSAVDILNKYGEKELKKVFYEYGELKMAARLANAITRARESAKITTSTQLIEVVREFVPARTENKFYAKLFQAIRIEVNREIEFLKEMLVQAFEVMKPGGRIVIITYHSLEDRIVKNFFRTGNFEGIMEKDFYGNTNEPFKLVNKKVITPGEDEIRSNSRSRSAKLRIAEKK